MTKRIWLDFPDSASLRNPFWVQASMSCIQLRFHTVSPSWWHYTPPSQSKVVVSKAEYGRYLGDVGVSKNRGFSQNGLHENNGKPPMKWMIWGGKPIIFGNIHVGSWWFMDNPKTGAYVDGSVERWISPQQVMLKAGWVTTTSPSEPRSTVSAVFLRRLLWHLETTQEGLNGRRDALKGS